jgi:hypothetical protein
MRRLRRSVLALPCLGSATLDDSLNDCNAYAYGYEETEYL